MYGTAAGVASIAKMWTDNGEFIDPDIYGDGGTRPTLTEVENWLTQLSNTMDIVLAGYGFVVPVVQATAISSIGQMIEAWTSDLVHNANSSGRFWTEKAVERGVTPLMAIRKDMDAWVGDNGEGLEGIGVPKNPDIQGKKLFIFDTL